MNLGSACLDVLSRIPFNQVAFFPSLMEEKDLEAKHAEAIRNYESKDPRDTLLHQIFVENFEEFQYALEKSGKHLPPHVIRELDAFLDCGIPEAGGYSTWRCNNGCPSSVKTIAFSCKRRGFCPRCGGRRMSQTAANIVDNVFPNQAARQWVISLPFELRFWVASDGKLMDKILEICNQEISNFYKAKARNEHGLVYSHTGGITFVQRAGGQINLNPHLHMLHLEGVFDNGSAEIREPKFFQVSKPTDEEVISVSGSISAQVIKMLQKLGMLKVEDDFCQVARQNPSGLDAIKEASIKSYIATGPRAGQEVRRLRSLGHDGERAVLKSSRCVSINGFSIHADTMVKKHRGQDLEKLLRYMARPPLSLDRLSLDDDGNVVWRLRNIFSDGTDALLFSPMELLEKISSIIPPPWLNLTRYFGCFAPNSEIRPLIACLSGCHLIEDFSPGFSDGPS